MNYLKEFKMSQDNCTVEERIKQIIQEYDLTSKSRDRDKVYHRAYFYSLLREEGWHLAKIGRLFNRNHATIINALKVHDAYYGKDKIYMNYIKQFDEIFKPSVKVQKDSIFDDVMNCHNTTQLRIIKERITDGWYDNTTSLLLCVPIFFYFFVGGVEKMLVTLS